ncbi:Sin3 histone deacetylase corepressor complex component SDS3 [Eumeta japonica]|uniref:Sin3 histone deacetylase corepressor complex component SDS3 n=1 Tax=Eumeta variegata TaxID=151549 RepID=A0A4C1ZG90_EUMVA|nr:Sin3 histone deacetylase corepressor complex component SDS3 [Eumeta japonica]
MSCQGSPYSGPQDEYDFEDDGYDDLTEYRDQEVTLPPHQADDSNEDTEEASETESPNIEEPLEKDQLYHDKMAILKKQLQQLEDGVYPEYLRRVKQLEHQLHECLRLNRIYREHMHEIIEREYLAEKKAAAKEFEEKKIELRENLLNDFEDKRKMIENERHSMELNGDSMEVKPVMKRILRRRANEPAPAPEKRRKPLTTTLTFLLDEREIEADLREIARNAPPSTAPVPANNTGHRHHVLSLHNNAQPKKQHNTNDSPVRDSMDATETRVEDGKLLYERRWFHRGQSVYVEGRDLSRFAGHIHSITDETIWVKKVNMEKVRIYTSQLARGKVTLKRRAS